jgi:hypothetical protein
MKKFYLLLIVFALLVSCNKDTDGDDVIDKEDKCPDTFGLVEFKGCPDSDEDGVPDPEDECPDEFGLEEFKGCPDTDEDGVPDKEDDCPEEYGEEDFNGCPDSDGDGIPDSEDECPNVYGYKSYKGCSDYDEMPMLVSECLKNYNFSNREVNKMLSDLNVTLDSEIDGSLCNSLVEMLENRVENAQMGRYYGGKSSNPYELDAYSMEKELNAGYIQAVYNMGNVAQYVVILKGSSTNPTFYLMQVLHGGKCNTGGTTKFNETSYEPQQIWVRHEAFKVPATLFTMRLIKSSKQPIDLRKLF